MNTLDQPDRPQLAAEVVRRFKLSDEARRLLHEETPAPRYFAELAKAELFDDAVRFAAHYLTPREAVWWGSLCVWQAFRREPPPQEARLLDIVSRWVLQPGEALRRAAHDTAKATGVNCVAAGLAMAVFYSGGSISIPDQPHVDPPEGETARKVVTAVMLAARKLPKDVRLAYLRHCLQLAGEVSRGEADPLPPQENPPTATSQEHTHAQQA